MTKRIGILTGGGDAPGLNAVIRAIVKTAVLGYRWEAIGIEEGFEGFLNKCPTMPLTPDHVRGLLPRGGSILGCTNKGHFGVATTDGHIVKNEAAFAEAVRRVRELELDALVVVGGEGSLSIALELWRMGVPVVGVPKTIDNDIAETDLTFGFYTALQFATDAIDRLHTTAESHNRVMVVEVMGRHTGWIAIYAGIAAGADLILVPEVPFRMSQVCDMLTKRKEMGRPFSIVVVAEDARPTPDEDFLSADDRQRIYREGHLGGIGQIVARLIEERTGLSTRVSVLGYIQRGGTPTANDRVLATRMGVYAVEMVLRGEFGRMAALRATEIVSVPLEEIADKVKVVDETTLQTAEVFFG